jgi:uncharacterized protein (DUF305 family)
MHINSAQSSHTPYGLLAIELAIDFVIMYLVMYSMIATLDHFYINLNNVYMTVMMAAPMAIIMLVSMRSMFPSPRLNWIIGVAAVLAFAASLLGMRWQTAVGDVQFLRSMIPHHSGALLMCQEALIKDAELKKLCERIVKSQTEEIVQMEAILQRLRSE